MCPTIDVLISTWALIHDNSGRIIYVLQYLFKYSLLDNFPQAFIRQNRIKRDKVA